MENLKPVLDVEISGIDLRYKADSRPKGFKYGIIEVTTQCQFRCPGCYMVRRHMLDTGEMNLWQAIKILDLCRDYRGAELETMDILGGEPLLWSHLQVYIDELLNRGILPWIFTNMSAITPNLAKWLLSRQVHITGKLNINPDNPKQLKVQAEMIGRGVGEAKQMISAISIFQNAGFSYPLFRLQNLIRKKNISLVPDYYRWCLKQNIGIDLELMGSGEAISAEYFRIAPTAKQIAKMIQSIQILRQEVGLEPAEVLMPHVFGSCPFYDQGLYFAVDGHIRACTNSTVKLADIKDPDPIRKAYESPLICNRLRLTQEIVGEPCHSCSKWLRCRGGCRATVEGLGNPFGGYPLCPVLYL